MENQLAGAETRKTLSQQINEGNTKLADFLCHNDDDGDDDEYDGDYALMI